MRAVTLSECESTSIVRALAHEDTFASRETLRELVRQGVNLPAWVERALWLAERREAGREAVSASA